jgi:predicted Ser/Thr protein kinase
MTDHILEKYRKLPTVKIYTTGKHADKVSLLKNNIVKKKYSPHKEIFFRREVKILKKLAKCNFVPKIKCIDKARRTIYMSYCGTPIAKLANHETEITNYINILLNKYGIYHNDIKKGNVCIHEGQLYLIDFSWANTVPYKVEENRPGYNTIYDYANHKKKNRKDIKKKNN